MRKKSWTKHRAPNFVYIPAGSSRQEMFNLIFPIPNHVVLNNFNKTFNGYIRPWMAHKTSRFSCGQRNPRRRNYQESILSSTWNAVAALASFSESTRASDNDSRDWCEWRDAFLPLTLKWPSQAFHWPTPHWEIFQYATDRRTIEAVNHRGEINFPGSNCEFHNIGKPLLVGDSAWKLRWSILETFGVISPW